ncbi:hypothetical protein ACIBG0_40245 [Nocardia sp. NPDC050630]|uniref:hypothetical protein n=1 Tax=Nocardia sp. NPDC050630 TaxID=3364321 RepID=UPI0037A457E0
MLAQADPHVVEMFRQLREENDVKRRELFMSAAVVGVAASTGVGDRVTLAVSGAGRPDAAAVAVVRSTLHAAMQLDDQLGSPAAAGLVAAQQQLTEAMLRASSADLRPALLSLHAEWTGLSGALAWDAGDYATAASRYETARETAHDAEDSDLAAYMLCGLSQLAIWQQRRRTAIDHAVAARAWVAQTEDRRLRAYVGMRMAEAAALNGQRTAVLDALDDAERDLDGLTPCNPAESRAYFVGAGMLESYRGSALAILGDAAPAADASRRAAALMTDPFVRDRAVTLLELSRPLVSLADIDEAADAIATAADLTEQNGSPRLASAIVDARHNLAPWSDARCVRDLDERLAARDIVSA